MEPENSAEIVVQNEDLLTEILLHLPIKSLSRFKCVSTQWLHNISTPYFSKTHSLRNAGAAPSGLFLFRYPSVTYLSLRIHDRHSPPSSGPVPIQNLLKITPQASHLSIMGACNGLMLCLLVAPPWHDTDIIYFVCNLTTKSCHPLPPLEDLPRRPIINMDLAFDPRVSPHYYVVCMRNCSPPDGPDYAIQIYSSNSGSWRECRTLFYDIPTELHFRGGIYWNKAIHYLNTWGGDSLYFEIETETMKPLPMPAVQTEIHTTKRSLHLGESGGHLHLVDIQTNLARESSIDIYELKRDYSGWFLRYRVDLSAMEAAFPEMVVQYMEAVPLADGTRRIRLGRYYSYSVLSVVQEEGGDGLEIVMSIPNKIIIYNPKDNRSKVLVYFGDDRDRVWYEWRSVIQYTETLVPV